MENAAVEMNPVVRILVIIALIAVSICPKCYCQNPPDNKFCGCCGSEIIYKKEY